MYLNTDQVSSYDDISFFINKDEYIDIIKRNFNKIFLSFKPYDRDAFIKKMIDSGNIDKENADFVISFILSEKNDMTDWYNYSILKRIIKCFGVEILDKYKDDIKNNINIATCILRGLNEENLEYDKDFFEEIIEKNKLEYVQLLMTYFQDFKPMPKEKEKDFKEFSESILLMIEELLKNEKKKFTDIKVIGSGAFCICFSIGEKVLKLGKKRQTYKIRNSVDILHPIIRREMKTTKDKKFVEFIEITEKTDTIDAKDLSDKQLEFYEEILYQLYKRLRKQGIIWGDPRLENMGILRKDNIPSLYGEKLYVDYESVGFADEDKPIKKDTIGGRKGDWVVIDTDYIYDQNDPEIKTPSLLSDIFFRRYEKEEKEMEK